MTSENSLTARAVTVPFNGNARVSNAHWQTACRVILATGLVPPGAGGTNPVLERLCNSYLQILTYKFVRRFKCSSAKSATDIVRNNYRLFGEDLFDIMKVLS